MDIRDLVPEVERNCRGAPEQRMEYGLLRAAREFCRKTWFLRRSQQVICTPGTTTYAISPPPNEEAFAVKHAQIQQLPSQSIIPIRFRYGTLNNPNQLQPNLPREIYIIPYKSFQVSPPPDQAYPILIELITQPIIDSEYMPDELGVEWDQALAYGALSWILSQTGNPWYDPQGAGSYLQLFNQEIIRAKARAANDFTPNNQAWLNPGFAFRWYG